MRHLFTVAFRCWLLMLVAAFGGVMTGTAFDRPPPALADLAACDLPCWRGITPRLTREADADRQMLALGFRKVEGVRARFALGVYRPPSGDRDCSARLNFSQGVVADIALLSCPHIRLGDVIALLGPPDGFIADNILSFDGASTFVTLRVNPCLPEFAPHAPVQSIFIALYSTAAGRELIVEHLSPWHGFAGSARYRLLASDLLDCG